MQNTTKKKLPAVLCAVLVLVILMAYIVVFCMALKGESEGVPVLVTIAVLYGVPVAALAVGIVIALRQRMKEIDGGEEEDAKKY